MEAEPASEREPLRGRVVRRGDDDRPLHDAIAFNMCLQKTKRSGPGAAPTRHRGEEVVRNETFAGLGIYVMQKDLPDEHIRARDAKVQAGIIEIRAIDPPHGRTCDHISVNSVDLARRDGHERSGAVIERWPVVDHDTEYVPPQSCCRAALPEWTRRATVSARLTSSVRAAPATGLVRTADSDPIDTEHSDPSQSVRPADRSAPAPHPAQAMGCPVRTKR